MRSISDKIAIVLICLMLEVGMAYASNCVAPSGQGFKIIGVTWGNATHEVSAGPGELDVPLTLTVENLVSSCNLVSVEGYLQLYGGLSNYNGTDYAEDFVSTVTPDSTFNIVFNLNIAGNETAAPNKTIALPLYISWNYSNSSIARTTQSYSLAIPFEGTPKFSFITPDRALIAGEDNNFTMQVSNTGSGYARDFVLSLSGNSSISLLGQPPQLGDIAPNQTENATLQIYVAPSLAGQSINLKINSHYISPYGYNTSLTGSLNLYAISASESTISVTPSTQTLVEGQIENISVIVANHGTSTIDNLSVLMSPVSPLSLIGSDTYINIPKLDAGQNVSLPIEVYVASSSSSSPVSTLDVQLSYDGQSESSPRVLSFLSPGFINVTEVSATVLPTTPTKGGIFSLTATLNNLGSTTASAAQVTAKAPKGLTIIGDNTTFIGSLDTDTPTAFTLSFRVSPTASTGTYVIPVVLTYSNNINQRVNKTLNFSVSIGASNSNTIIVGSGANATQFRERYYSSGPSLLEIAAVVVVIVVVAGAAFYFYRQRAKKVHAK